MAKAFQQNAFQINAFQIEAIEGDAFQPCAFQDDAFQTSICGTVIYEGDRPSKIIWREEYEDEELFQMAIMLAFKEDTWLIA